MSQQQQVTAIPANSSNGVLTAKGTVGGNRKKAKRRAKAAARHDDAYSVPDGNPPLNGQPPPPNPPYPDEPVPYHSDYPQDQYDEQYVYTSGDDDEPIAHDRQYPYYSTAAPQSDVTSGSKSKKKRKNKRNTNGSLTHSHDPHGNHTTISTNATNSRPRAKTDSIWNTSTQEERERIKEFWLSLGEHDRKSLLKIEKNAVLAKMKEQQRNSCSCTVCGRKRMAIEEELEVLYDAYYEELAQYANRPEEMNGRVLDQVPASLAQPLAHPLAHALPPRPLLTPQQHRTSRVQEIIEDDQPYSDEEEEELYSDEDEIFSDDEDYEDNLTAGIGSGFFDFGQNLQVKGGSFITDMLTHLHGKLNNLPDGILTVADDLLKNDGKKFIEMMEQLAERRMQREQEIEYNAHHNTHHGDPPLDDEEDFDDEDDYDSQDDYDDEEEEEDEMGGMTEAQRMEEGRRMFQIFAARMFEQRVLTAYREKVAAERQAQLLQELEEEDKVQSQKTAQKQKNAEKKKNKKLAQKQAKAEEKAKKEAEEKAKREAEEELARRRQEELQRKKDEQKRKRDEAKRLQEEENQKREAERARRQQEKLEADRKLREQKAVEKRQREEAKRKEREEREAQAQLKAQEEKLKREQEAKEKNERQKPDSNKSATQPTPQIMKRPSQPSQIAVPPSLTSHKSNSGMSSPHIPVALPAVPKAPTPVVRPRQAPEQEAHHSPKGGTNANKSKPPGGLSPPQQMAPKTILQNPHKQQRTTAVSVPQPHPQQGPPPGVHPPYQSGFGNMGFPPFTGQMPGPHQRQAPPFSPHTAMPAPGLRGPPAGPGPMTNGFGVMPQGRGGFAGNAPPGFTPHMPGLGSHAAAPMEAQQRAPGTHSRNQSTDLDMSPGAQTHPISRPAPIQRPSSVRPSAEQEAEADDGNKHLGSRALLDDGDDALLPAAELRRTSNPIGAPRNPKMSFNPQIFGGPAGTFGMPAGAPHWPSTSPGAFAPAGSALPTPSWGGPIGGSNWSNAAFGPLNTTQRPPNVNRSRALRLAVCQACRQLNTPGNEYHDVALVIQQIARNNSFDGPLSVDEVADICETEGDAHNGGGLLRVRNSGPHFTIRYELDVASPASGRPTGNALGEIGSPVPGNAVPAFGGSGRPFGNMGGVASPGGF